MPQRFGPPRRLTAAGLALLAAVFFAGAARAQDARTPLVGLWLIEPDYYDVFVDSGLDVPAVPVLSLTADGNFRLIRVRPVCEPADEAGEAIDFAVHPARWLAACRRDRAAAAAAGVPVNALPSAAGTWEVLPGGRVRFAATVKSPTLTMFARLLPDFRRAMAAGRFERIGETLSAAEKATRDRRLAAQAKRIESFYGTFYVFDGAPAAFALEGDTLRLTGETPDDTVVYRRATPGPLASAMHIVLAVELSATAYFRCTHDRLRAAAAGTAPPAGELAAFAAMAAEYYALNLRREEAGALAAAGKPREAAALFTAQDLAADRALAARIAAHPGGAAAKAKKFGAWLGCPARDDW